MNLNSLPTEQIFEVPSNLFVFGDPQYQPKEETKSKKSKSQEKAKIALTKEDQNFLGKLKRRIFFISATLTR